ncbi:phosphoglycolate phosphatase [Stutzerimonas urumqiensis]|uniref:phosphoglycolate phosphatase n=1 Tax=Stutzerimonas urumqiensis TaxID=638269 RepID=UPI000EB2F2A8|nr:phosphoglycolate phosphatase [Stutzerimonas urumqiensis]
MTALERLFGGQLPKLVMFDLDGTLLDSVPDLAAAVDAMLLQLGRPSAGIERVRDWVGNGALVLVRRALAGGLEHDGVDEGEAERALALFLEAYAGGHALTTVYPGVIGTLEWLAQRDVPLAVITNKPERFVRPLLQEKGLDRFFGRIVGGDTLPRQKPAPDGLLHVMASVGVSADACLFIGDSRNDIQAARAAGMRCVGLRYGYNHGRPIDEENPDLTLDQLGQLIGG